MKKKTVSPRHKFNLSLGKAPARRQTDYDSGRDSTSAVCIESPVSDTTGDRPCTVRNDDARPVFPKDPAKCSMPGRSGNRLRSRCIPSPSRNSDRNSPEWHRAAGDELHKGINRKTRSGRVLRCFFHGDNAIGWLALPDRTESSGVLIRRADSGI